MLPSVCEALPSGHGQGHGHKRKGAGAGAETESGATKRGVAAADADQPAQML